MELAESKLVTSSSEVVLVPVDGVELSVILRWPTPPGSPGCTVSVTDLEAAVADYAKRQLPSLSVVENLAAGVARVCCVDFGAERANVAVRIGKRAQVPVQARSTLVQIKRTRQFFLPGEVAGERQDDDDEATRIAKRRRTCWLPNISILAPSPWAKHLKPSPTLAVKDVAEQLKRSGAEVFDFGVGEMNPFIPVPHALRAAIAAAQLADAHSHYTAAPGDDSLLQVLSDDFRHFGMRYEPSQIVVCPGPKDAIFKACLALVNPSMARNRVVAFAPSYEAFENVPPLTTGKPAIILPTDDRFFPRVEELERLLATDPSIAIIIVNSPNNPTGVVYPASLIAELARVIGKHPQVAVISDESYRTTIYNDDEPYSSIAHHLPFQTLVVCGISKELSSTGLRLGWVAGPKRIIRVIANVHGNATSCVNLPVQVGLAQFLRNEKDMESRKEIKRQLQSRRDVALELFSSLPCLKRCTLTASQGAFYLFPDVRAFLGTRAKPQGDNARAPAEETVILTDKDLALYLLRVAKVVAIPGSEFQRAGHLRLCYARDESTLRAGFHAMDAALALLTSS